MLSADANYIAFVTDITRMSDGTDPPARFFSCLGRDSDSGPSDSASPSGSGSSTPAVAERIPCQVVMRQLVPDAGDNQRTPRGSALASTNTAGAASDDDVTDGPSVTQDGASVAFTSFASDLVPDDTNSGGERGGSAEDVFVRTWKPVLTGTSIDFGPVDVGTTVDRTITVTLTGFGPLTPGTVTVTGTNKGDFTIGANTCTGVELRAPATCAVAVTFKPGGSGTRTGTVTVASSDPTVTVPVLQVPVRGSGNPQQTTPPPTSTPPPPPVTKPLFAANPTVVNFGAQLPLASPGAKKTITISNPGTGRLGFSSFTVIDQSVPGARADYTVNSSGCAAGVAPGGSCTVTVTFVGHAVGTRPAVLQIHDNAAGGINLIGLTATIAKPKITLNPAVSPSGRAINIGGVGFAPNRVVNLVLDATTAQMTAKANAKGVVTAGFVVLPNTPMGPRTITASTNGADPSISAVASLLIVPGSQQTPGLVVRH